VAKWQLVRNFDSCRAALEAYTTAVRAVALRLLRLTAAGLGLDEGHFEGELTAGPVIMNVNHYVPCPEPSLTMGLAPHCDPNVVTVLADNGVCGLQARQRGSGGGWVDVEPLPGALVVNFGHQMEVVSNGALRGGEHRVVTNARAARTSLATFVMPAMGCAVAAAPGMVPDGEAPQYRPFTYQEFMGAYTAAIGDRDAVLARFQNKD
jgi:2'-deoxymugineic-acid 2'-dioxygenase / mugineic-acid 3-dioxygenase